MVKYKMIMIKNTNGMIKNLKMIKMIFYKIKTITNQPIKIIYQITMKAVLLAVTGDHLEIIK